MSLVFEVLPPKKKKKKGKMRMIAVRDPRFPGVVFHFPTFEKRWVVIDVEAVVVSTAPPDRTLT